MSQFGGAGCGPTVRRMVRRRPGGERLKSKCDVVRPPLDDLDPVEAGRPSAQGNVQYDHTAAGIGSKHLPKCLASADVGSSARLPPIGSARQPIEPVEPVPGGIQGGEE